MKYTDKILLLSAVVLSGALCEARPVWKDPVPMGKNSAIWKLSNADELRVDVLASNLFRVRRSWTNCWTESGMNRYGVLKRDWPDVSFARTGDTLKTAGAEVTVNAKDGTLRLKSLVSAADLTIDPENVGKGFSVRFPLVEGERMYGLGDVSRENIQRRGKRYEIWVKNVNSYIPMPMIVSSKGWGLLMNTTWRNYFDVGEKDKDALVCEAPEGEIDFYVFTGKDYKALLDIYTQLSGRPQMLPAFGYGFTFVANQFIDQFNLVRDCYEFRKIDFPCDVIGLEPGWMEKFYDFSTRKTWNPRLFTFPSWTKARSLTWIGALDRIGFKLSLWLCFNYDLYRYEEQCAIGAAKAAGRKMEVAEGVPETWIDQNIVGEVRSRKKTETNVFVTPGIDRSQGDEVKYKEGDQPWFEHLKKFVDRGAQCFKLDGSQQVTPHDPNRKWANGMSTEEAHNLYPLLYDKQMARGYEDYTSRRSMVYSAGGYAGVQQYVATWAGDTGGGPKPLISCMNLGMSGHPNQSCDLSPYKSASIHFAVLSPWTQQNNWDYWDLPWVNTKEHLDMKREYIKLRYRLFPYVYSTAAHSAETGWPIMRSLPFVYPDRKEYDEAKGTYMFGDMMLVSAFVGEMDIPEGVWHDWRTGETVQGPCRKKVATTPMWGGALYVKAGAIVPTWPQKQHIEQGWNDKVIVKVWPTADGEFVLHEDDGISLGYRSGKAAKTKLSVKKSGEGIVFAVGKRQGAYKGMPQARAFEVEFHLDKRPASVMLGNKSVEGVWNEAEKTFTVSMGDVGTNGASLSVK